MERTTTRRNETSHQANLRPEETPAITAELESTKATASRTQGREAGGNRARERGKGKGGKLGGATALKGNARLRGGRARRQQPEQAQGTGKSKRENPGRGNNWGYQCKGKNAPDMSKLYI